MTTVNINVLTSTLNTRKTKSLNFRIPMNTERPRRSRKRSLLQQLSAGASPGQAYKKQKLRHPDGPLLPAPFWDNLSKVWLTHNALREFDRRSKPVLQNVPAKRQLLRPVTRGLLRNIREVANQGGLDLSDLRGVRLT
jgi:hypothetical protein